MKNKHQCPRCSGKLQKRSGFEVCAQCGYVVGSQSLETEHDSFNYELARGYTAGSDEQFRTYRGDRPRRRTPLNFDED